ncbi:MAG: hypothetical protein H0X39_14400 [Actinobacteria bacterium]|nr:hypothetical protein [Actinomycetota bacterium]
MEAVAATLEQPKAWRVSRDGFVIALLHVRETAGSVVVTAEAGPNESSSPYRFDSLAAADAFMDDLMTSFAYLGCDIAQS